jgi:hypothetical protein
MTELERLMLNLEISVNRNGVKPLTNEWMLNLVKLTLKKQKEKEEKEKEIGEYDPYFD